MGLLTACLFGGRSAAIEPHDPSLPGKFDAEMPSSQPPTPPTARNSPGDSSSHRSSSPSEELLEDGRDASSSSSSSSCAAAVPPPLAASSAMGEGALNGRKPNLAPLAPLNPLVRSHTKPLPSLVKPPLSSGAVVPPLKPLAVARAPLQALAAPSANALPRQSPVGGNATAAATALRPLSQITHAPPLDGGGFMSGGAGGSGGSGGVAYEYAAPPRAQLATLPARGRGGSIASASRDEAPPPPPAEDEEAPPPPPKPMPKSALKKSGGLPPKAVRRQSWSTERPEPHLYSPKQEPPVDDYRSTMGELQNIRNRRMVEGRSELSFAQLVSELDAMHGGEGLSCLVPRKVDPPPGSWMSNRAQTWGQIQSQATATSLGSSGTESHTAADYR